MKKLRVGHLNYLLGLPLYTALAERRIRHSAELVPGVPAELNKALKNNELDVSLVSTYHYLTHQDELELLPGFCIAAEGRVMSVNLYVKDGDISGLDGAQVALTPQSASAAQLVKVMCKNFWQVKPEFVTLPNLEEATRYSAFLLIGDQALLNPIFPGYKTIDLATAWHEKTMLPMPFGVFAVTKEAMEKDIEAVTTFAIQLEESLDWGEDNMSSIRSTVVDKSGLAPEVVKEYFSLLRYRMGDSEWDGLRSFASLSELAIPERPEALVEEVLV